MKVIFFLHEIQHYRIPIFRLIAKKIDLTLCTNKKDQIKKYENECFSVEYLPIKKLGPFLIHSKNIYKIARNFDVTVGLMNLRCIDIVLMPLNPFLKTKIIFWGIGVSASYNRNFDVDNRLDFLRFWLFEKANALLFYTDYPIKKYAKNKVSKAKMFVANNTVEVLPTNNNNDTSRKDILFIGSLYAEKGINYLLEAYLEAYNTVGSCLNRLVIIGDGKEYYNVQKFIDQHKLQEKIVLEGAIYDQKILKEYFLNSIVSISPKQAGLSVLMSMGYGVCFITSKNAITGGEILNIDHGKTGLFYKDKKELISYLIDVYRKPEKFVNIGRSAKNYYDSERQPSQMADGIINAIKYVIS
ncbi:glycosyltransferase [Tenacibaculum singaporense]|uniref:glycosyltransferase n=1 Tax=Tenacibaculum singaporense TaxID=2358479 RepID=UPI000F6594FC|nr:glycosyltransferase [Tenacibaculum singaporense]RSC93567.1 glycosyltransferase [Tenacibaculum singaporense]